MSNEHLFEFEKKLKAATEKSNSVPINPLEEASLRFDKIYEKQLEEAEEAFLASILPIVQLTEKAANAIEEKERFPWLRTQTYGTGGLEYRLKKIQRFYIEEIGQHGDECYPLWEGTGRFVQKVEGGQQIEKLIKGLSIGYSFTGIYFGIEAIKDAEAKISSVTLKLSESSEDINIKGPNFSLFIDRLVKMITNKEYVDHRSVGINMGEGWTSN